MRVTVELDSVTPDDDSGSDALNRFVYQAHVAFADCLNCATDNGVEAVICEHIEDLCVVEDDRIVLTQIKTRNADYGPWKLKDLCAQSGALRSLLRAHRVMKSVDSGRREVAYEVVLEGALAPRDGIRRLADAPVPPDELFAADVAELLNPKAKTTVAEVHAMLLRTRVRTAPPREAIDAINVKLLSALGSGLPHQQLSATYDNVIATIAQAMRGGLALHWPAPLFAAQGKLDTARVAKSKRLDRDRLAAAFGPVLEYAEGPERQAAALARYRRAVARRGEHLDLGTLGAQLPPLPMATLDMTVNGALPNQRDTGEGYPLPWIIRRVGRATLVGPPGCGKTVAARDVAAFYARRDDWPIPLVVSLPRVLERRREVGDLDATARSSPASGRPSNTCMTTWKSR